MKATYVWVGEPAAEFGPFRNVRAGDTLVLTRKESIGIMQGRERRLAAPDKVKKAKAEAVPAVADTEEEATRKRALAVHCEDAAVYWRHITQLTIPELRAEAKALAAEGFPVVGRTDRLEPHKLQRHLLSALKVGAVRPTKPLPSAEDL